MQNNWLPLSAAITVISCWSETFVFAMNCQFMTSMSPEGAGTGGAGWSRVGKCPPWKNSVWAWPTLEILAVM